MLAGEGLLPQLVNYFSCLASGGAPQPTKDKERRALGRERRTTTVPREDRSRSEEEMEIEENQSWPEDNAERREEKSEPQQAGLAEE